MPPRNRLVASIDATTNIHNLAFGTRGGHSFGQQTLVYGAAIAWNLLLGTHGIVTVTDGNAFAFSAPTFGATAFSAVAPFTSMQGLTIRLTIRNASGGALGAGTFNAIFKTSGNASATATGNSRSYDFEWNGSNFIEIFRGANDVAN